MTVPSLAGQVVALSLSPPNDLGRLGYPPREFRQLAFSLALRTLQAGGRISHGGHLHPGSMLVDIVDHLAAMYGAQVEAGAEKPLLHMLAQNELSSTRFTRLTQALERMRAFAETRVPLVGGGELALSTRRASGAQAGAGNVTLHVRRDGEKLKALTCQKDLDDLAASLPAATVPEALQRMREAQTAAVSARVAVGGRRGDLGVTENRDIYAGRIPGIYEEALISLDDGHPVLFLGAFGGATRDVAVDLDLIAGAERVPMLGEMQTGVAGAQTRMREKRGKIPNERRAALARFAERDDSETLARDIVAWLAEQGSAAKG